MTTSEELRLLRAEVAVLRERVDRNERATVELSGDLHSLSGTAQLRGRGQLALASLVEDLDARRLETAERLAPEAR